MSIVLVQYFRKAEGLTRLEFQEHWRERHARHGLNDPAVLRYTQYHTLPDDPFFDVITYFPEAKGREAYDGVATLAFDSVEAAHAALQGEHFAAARAEEPLFVDQARSTMALMREHIMLAPVGDPPIVTMEVFRTRADVPFETCMAIWSEHGEMGKDAAAIMPGYLQFRLASGDREQTDLPGLADGAERWHGMAMGFHYSMAGFRNLGRLFSSSNAAREDEERFVDIASFTGLATRRHVIKHLVR